MIGSFARDLQLPKTSLAIFFLLIVFTGSRADVLVPTELQRCASVEEATERLACYDNLAGRSAPAAAATDVVRPAAEQPAEPAPAAAAVASSAPAAPKTLDDIDSETNPKAVAEEEENLLVRARVTRCEKDARKKYYFVFDNGQVWKQVSDKRLRYKECDFDVTITRDFFGYKMQVDGEKGRIRIDRIK